MPAQWIPRFVVLATMLTLIGVGCHSSSPTVQRGSAPSIRVLLASGVRSIPLAASVASDLQLTGGGAVPIAAGESLDLALDSSGWRIRGRTLPRGELRLQQAADGAVRVNGHRYRGQIRFLPLDGGKFDVVNDVEVDGYLKGVVTREMPAKWNLEAHRAQAVASRTYVLFEARTKGVNSPFDVMTDTRSQVYGGMDDETPQAVQAVDTTRGLVLAYGPSGREKIFKAYFSSCCGGVTASAHETFNDPIQEPMLPVNNGATCNASTKFNWGPISFTKAELTRRIKAYGAKRDSPEQNMAALSAIEIGGTNQFGRPTRYVVVDARGNRFSLTSEQMRWAINTDPAGGATISSGFFKPVNDGANVTLVEGHGFGHGVGMCQWCCQARAAAGQRVDRILAQAYPKARLVRAY